jgi:hypothetical protein
MHEASALCVRCGYPARGVEDRACPECGQGRVRPGPAGRLDRFAMYVWTPRVGLLRELARPGGSGRWAWHLITASLIAGAGVVWACLIDAIRGTLQDPVQGVVVLAQLTLVCGLLVAAGLGLLVLAEHAAVAVALRWRRGLRTGSASGLLSARLTSYASQGLPAGAVCTLALVAGGEVIGLAGVVALLPVVGLLAGVGLSLRAFMAALWTAARLREAGAA